MHHHEAKVPGCCSPRKFGPTNGFVACRFICQLSAVFGCIRNVSSVLDDDLGVGDDGSTVFDVAPRYLISVSSPRLPSTMLSGSSMGHERIKKPNASNGSPPKYGSMNRPSNSSRPLSTQIKIHRKDVFADWNIIAAKMAGDTLTFAFLASETTDLRLRIVFGLRSLRSSPLRMETATSGCS